MRLKLILAKQKGELLPLNYQYELSSVIYKIIHSGDANFADWLHSKGYNADKKPFKLFTFSNIFPGKFKIAKDRMKIISNTSTVYVSFYPIEIIEKFIMGLFKNQKFKIGDAKSEMNFYVQTVEKLKEPDFGETTKYRLLSPLHVARKNPFNNKIDYLHPEHKAFNEIVFNNLIDKYNAHRKEERKFDTKDWDLKPLSEAKSRLITVKANTKQETRLKAYLFNFELTAPVEIQRIAYYAGFGKSNALGFGCAEVI